MSEYHYWIATTDPTNNNKPYLLYGCPAREGEEKARQRGMELLSGLDFQIKRLPTRDMGKASSLMKFGRLEQSHSLKKAAKRMGHEKSLRQRKRRSNSPFM